MIRGLYTAATSMKTQMEKMDVISNNMSNSNTVGFKKDSLVQTAFHQELTKRINEDGTNYIGSMSNGVGTSNIRTSFKQGILKETGGPLDIAIDGDGFFAINSNVAEGGTKERYTRAGAFTLNNEGTLVTSSGEPVLSTNNTPIKLSGTVAINSEGGVYIDNELVANLKIVSFEDTRYLTKYGEGLYDASEDAVTKEFKGNIKQCFTESSNVDVIKEMVNMITLTRNYEANQKAIQTHDTLLDKAVNQVGRL